MKYDVFISYRRDGGSEKAELLKTKLESKGYKSERIFMDTHSIKAGNWKERVKLAISQSVNFIVIITNGCFEKKNEEDAFLYELEIARSLKKHIIPVLFDGIKSINEDKLPEQLKDLHYENAPRYEHEYTDAFYKKLYSFIKPDPELKRKKMVVGFICLLIVLLAAILFWKSCVKYVNNPDDTTISMPIIEGAVDLGLPSGTFWGECNLGAKKSYEYGDYYVWGEVKSKQLLTKSNNKNILPDSIIGTSYDAASVLKGEKWSMPSEEQFAELINECEWEWTTQEGHTGYLVTGINGNTIFLPACGCIKEKGLDYNNQFGYYWIGEKASGSKVEAKELIIGLGEINIENGKQSIARSIRPVTNPISQ